MVLGPPVFAGIAADMNQITALTRIETISPAVKPRKTYVKWRPDFPVIRVGVSISIDTVLDPFCRGALFAGYV